MNVFHRNPQNPCRKSLQIPSGPEGNLQQSFTAIATCRLDCFCQRNRTKLFLDTENNVTTCSKLPQLATTSRKGPRYPFFTVICNITPVFGQWQRSVCVNDSSCWQGSFDVCLVASEYAGHRRGWRKCPGTHSIVADMSKTMR